jgi:hypothetical protein
MRGEGWSKYSSFWDVARVLCQVIRCMQAEQQSPTVDAKYHGHGRFAGS